MTGIVIRERQLHLPTDRDSVDFALPCHLHVRRLAAASGLIRRWNETGQAHSGSPGDELLRPPMLSAKLIPVGYWRSGKSACAALDDNLPVIAHVR